MKQKLSKADRAYVEKHRARPAHDLAAELGCDPGLVTEHLESLPPAEPEKIADFAARDGTVAMTSSQATRDDEAPAPAPPAGKRLPEHMHVIDPTKPVR